MKTLRQSTGTSISRLSKLALLRGKGFDQFCFIRPKVFEPDDRVNPAMHKNSAPNPHAVMTRVPQASHLADNSPGNLASVKITATSAREQMVSGALRSNFR